MFKKGDKVKYLESDGWKYGTFDKSFKSKVSSEFDTAFIDHASPSGHKFYKLCMLNEIEYDINRSER